MKHTIAALALCTAATYAQTPNFEINASQIVTGTMQPVNWNEVVNSQNQPAAASSQYSTLSSVWHDQLPIIWLGGWNFYRPSWYSGPGWAPQESANVEQPFAAVKAIPTFTTTDRKSVV